MSLFSRHPLESVSYQARSLINWSSLIMLSVGLFNQFSHASWHLPGYADRNDLDLHRYNETVTSIRSL